MIHVAVVQTVLLYRSETWVMTPQIGRVLGGFHHRMAHRMMGQQYWRGRDSGWVYPPMVEAMGGGGIRGGGDPLLPPPEHICTVHCYQAHYGPGPGGRASSGVKCVQAVVGTGLLRIERNMNGGSVDGMIGGGGRDRKNDEIDGLKRWEDNVARIISGTEPNAPLSSALGMELHHPIMRMTGGHGGRLERWSE